MRKIVLMAGAALMLFAGAANADIISVNFLGSTTAGAGTLNPTDQAGNPNESAFVSNWNNASGQSATLSNLVTSSGASTATSVTWVGGESHSLPTSTGGTNLSGGANPVMMLGYIGSISATTAATISFNNLVPSASTYDVIVYFDGDNAGNWRVASYTIGSTTLSGEDSENVNFNIGTGNNANGLFQKPVTGGAGNTNWPVSPNNGEGNYVRFTGLTGSTFTLSAVGANQSDNNPRAPINGIQVIGLVPEPASASLIGIAALGLLARRRTGYSAAR